MSALGDDAKALAKAAVKWVTTQPQVGQDVALAVWSILAGGGTGNAASAISAFVEGVFREAKAILTDLELEAEIRAANAAVDAEVDVAEETRLAAMASKGIKPG